MLFKRYFNVWMSILYKLYSSERRSYHLIFYSFLIVGKIYKIAALLSLNSFNNITGSFKNKVYKLKLRYQILKIYYFTIRTTNRILRCSS